MREVDQLLQGGFPLGAITELVGPECSGRTSLALTFVAGLTQAGKVCAWVDVSDALHPASAAALGVDLSRLLWIRCGVSWHSSFEAIPTASDYVLQKSRQSKTRIAAGRVAAIPGWKHKVLLPR